MSERPLRCLLCESRLSNPVCQVGPDSLARLAALTETVSYAAGQRLFSQGDPAGGIFLVRSGRVKLVHGHVDGSEQVLRTAGPGETLGIGAPPDDRMNVSAVASAPTNVCRTNAARVEDLIRNDPDFSLAWAHMLSDEINRSREAILNLGPHSAAVRLARYLLKNCREAREVRMTHADLAATLSMAPETATRLLGAMEKASIVHLRRGRIQILDVDRLAALGGYPGSNVESA